MKDPTKASRIKNKIYEVAGLLLAVALCNLRWPAATDALLSGRIALPAATL